MCIHLYLLHIPYWLYKLYRYVRSNGYILDLKPWDNDPTFGTWYIALLYRLTWERAHLHLYNHMYTALKKLKVREDPKQGLFQFLIKTLFLMGWYLLRLVTSIPRQVILDSYEWSGRFRTKEDLNNWQFLLANGLCTLIMTGGNDGNFDNFDDLI